MLWGEGFKNHKVYFLLVNLLIVNFCVQIMFQKVTGSETNQACGLASAHNNTR
jgi:hypothetical protein